MQKCAWLVLFLMTGSLFAGLDLEFNGGVYPALRWDELGSTFMMMSAETDVTARYSNDTRDLAAGVFQIWAATPMHDQSIGLHFGEAYLTVPVKLGWPTLKAGQAVIPFGLLADYDTHAQIIQPPYARTLGVRIDPGAGFQGKVGITDYAFWISNGNGPYWMDVDRNKVVTARVAPKFLLGDAELTLGLSGLAGYLPYYHLANVPSMDAGPFMYRMRQVMGMNTGYGTMMDSTFQWYMDSTYRMYQDSWYRMSPYSWMDTLFGCGSVMGCGMNRAHRMKYRLALDNTTDWGRMTLHLEGVVGRDLPVSAPYGYGYNYYQEPALVYSYYLEARYGVTSWLEPIVRYDGVHVDLQGTHRVASGGVTLSYPDLSSVSLQTVYQYEWMDLVGMQRRLWNITAQIAFRF
jgi:hypothetical protein